MLSKSYNQQILLTERDTLIGFNLGIRDKDLNFSDISGIERDYGISMENGLGVNGRMITRVPHDDILYGSIRREGVTFMCLISNPMVSSLFSEISREALLASGLKFELDREIFTAWGSSGFAISMHEKYAKDLDDLYVAIINKNVLIGINLSEHMKPGLSILVASSLPDDIKREYHKKDLISLNSRFKM